MASLKFKNINKIYPNGSQAVFDFNLDVTDKEFIVFVGPSGCGKSTTLRMIAGLEEITKGDFLIDNKRVNDVSPKDRDIAMVFQSYALYPHMTVAENMGFGLKLRKLPKEEVEKKVREAAKMLGLTEYLDRKPKALSGGQRQRVALGRAITRNAKVFLMDEPLSNLDAKLRGQTRAEITALHERIGATTIYVTHDQIEAMTMASRIVVMKDGRIQQIGSPREIYNNPDNVFVGGFIGSPPMNFLKATLKDGMLEVSKDIILKVPAGKLEKLKEAGYDNKSLIVGIRPEDVHTEGVVKDTYKESTFKMEVKIAEFLGSESFIHAEINNTPFVGKIDGRTEVHNGDKLEVAIDMNKVHYFDEKTEKNISNNK